MGDKDQLKTADEICERLEYSQEMIERIAFDAINQQDKVANIVNAGMSNIMELLTKLEIVSIEFEEAMKSLKGTAYENAAEALTGINSIILEIAGQYQEISEEQVTLSEIVHNMENEIAIHRDSMELAEELLFQIGRV